MTFRVTIFILLSVFIILHKKIHGQQSVENFGTVIGSNRGTVAYSNQENTYVSNKNNYITHNNSSTFTGMKWQCVEYARRWLVDQKDISFGQVDYAINLPYIKEMHRISQPHKLLRLNHFFNAQSHSLEIGDLLIYDTTYAPITGHVAVVVDISDTHVFVAEQNHDNTIWENSHYSRKIPYMKNALVFHVQEEGLASWIRFEET
jgi:hypothetical protein